MSVPALLIRVLVTVAALWLLLRLADRRSLAQAGPLEVILAILVGNLGAGMMMGQASMPAGLLAVGLLLWLHLLVSAVVRRSRWLQGRSRVLVRHGRVQFFALQQARLTGEHLQSLLRECGAERIGDIEELRLEPDGELVLIPMTRREDAWQHAA